MRSSTFHDFDAFAESIKGIDSKMLMRNADQRVWHTCLVDLGVIDIQMGRLGSGNIAQGQLRSDGFLVYLPLTAGVEYTANGKVMEKHTCAILEPGCEFCISTRKDHDWLAAFVPSTLLQSQYGSFAHSSTVRVTVPDRHASDHYRSLCTQILHSAAMQEGFEASAAAARAANEVSQSVAAIIGMPQAPDEVDYGRTRIPREQIIQPCLDLIEQRGEFDFSIKDLLIVADVSERTLRAAFQEYFGLSPLRYLHLKRLHQIQQVLWEADPAETTVSQVLAAHGEWAFSRFASRYRKHFGELPSETLKKTNRASYS